MKKILSTCMVMLAIVALASTAWAQLSFEQKLGKKLYFDKRLSINQNQSCASCHNPRFGFADPNRKYPTSEGSVAGLFGTRNAPSSAYAAFSPVFFWDAVNGLYVGGQFWDGRANTLADQAAGPPLNPVEMAMPSKAAVVQVLAGDTNYVRLFKCAYAFDVVTAATTDPGVEAAYDLMTKAIGEFEKTSVFTAFTSKFDYFNAGLVQLTAQEANGLALFNGKAQCNLCHLSAGTTAPDGVSTIPALFTDHTYDNLGVPKNLRIPAYQADPLLVDNGLGGRADIAATDPSGFQLGKFKVMTLRNIAATPPYAHNGVFRTLKEIVHFYNTRDTLGVVCTNNLDPNFGITCWPAPEVTQNMNVTELGNLGLTDAEENDIVAFLCTLTDGYADPHTGHPPGALTPVVLPPMH